MFHSRRKMLRLAFAGAAVVLVGSTSGLLAAPAAARPRLQLVGPRPGPRRDHNLTADLERGRLYLFGGRVGGRALSDLWEYDPVSQVWTELTSDGPGPDGRFGHNAAYDPTERRLVVALGQAGPTFFNDVWACQPETGVWARLDDPTLDHPAPRYGSAAAFDPTLRRLLVSHGFTSRGRFDDTWAFDLESGTWSSVPTQGTTPVRRCLARGAFDASTNRLLLFGGQADARPFLGDLWALDLGSGGWTELAGDGLPGPRHLYAAAVSPAGAWHVIGGNSPSGPSDEHWIYDPAPGTWRLGGGFTARVSHDIAILGDHMYGFGGTDGSAELDDTWAHALT